MSVRLKNASLSKKLPLNIRIQWNAGTACVSERVLKTLACRCLRVSALLSSFLGLGAASWCAVFLLLAPFA